MSVCSVNTKELYKDFLDYKKNFLFNVTCHNSSLEKFNWSNHFDIKYYCLSSPAL